MLEVATKNIEELKNWWNAFLMNYKDCSVNGTGKDLMNMQNAITHINKLLGINNYGI